MVVVENTSFADVDFNAIFDVVLLAVNVLLVVVIRGVLREVDDGLLLIEVEYILDELDEVGTTVSGCAVVIVSGNAGLDVATLLVVDDDDGTIDIS